MVNITFKHDPNWNVRFLSVQGCYDAFHGTGRGGNTTWKWLAPLMFLLPNIPYIIAAILR
jgi:hypothetical protein